MFCRGLFDRHRLLFGFRVAVEVLRANDSISNNEWRAFLGGSTASTEAEIISNEASAPEWVADKKSWGEFLALEKILQPKSSTLRCSP